VWRSRVSVWQFKKKSENVSGSQIKTLVSPSPKVWNLSFATPNIKSCQSYFQVFICYRCRFHSITGWKSHNVRFFCFVLIFLYYRWNLIRNKEQTVSGMAFCGSKGIQEGTAGREIAPVWCRHPSYMRRWTEKNYDWLEYVNSFELENLIHFKTFFLKLLEDCSTNLLLNKPRGFLMSSVRI